MENIFYTTSHSSRDRLEVPLNGFYVLSMFWHIFKIKYIDIESMKIFINYPYFVDTRMAWSWWRERWKYYAYEVASALPFFFVFLSFCCLWIDGVEIHSHCIQKLPHKFTSVIQCEALHSHSAERCHVVYIFNIFFLSICVSCMHYADVCMYDERDRYLNENKHDM